MLNLKNESKLFSVDVIDLVIQKSKKNRHAIGRKLTMTFTVTLTFEIVMQQSLILCLLFGVDTMPFVWKDHYLAINLKTWHGCCVEPIVAVQNFCKVKCRCK